jgi:site-specific DNA-methyltransferase (adenine-specific)
MSRVETIGDCTLYLGDCREILPTLGPVDAVISDPPYGVGFKYESHVDDPDTYPALMRDVVAHVERLRGDGPAVFWQGMLNADRWHEWFPKGFRLFAACKGFTQFRPTTPQFGWDPVVFWGKSTAKPAVGARDWHLQSLAPFGYGRENCGHPCPRPLEQMRYVIETFTSSGETVLDPFMGSGTTGIACAKLGRKFTGIEIDETYFNVACLRITAAYAQPDLFVETGAKPEQLNMLETG